jgi:hypothetical protein
VRLTEETGLSLLEALTALAVLLFASVASLGIYERMWSSYKNGENAAEQQQAVRIAFDKIVLDLQLSGFNHNPDRSSLRPDEQIEAAYDTAAVVRADFDATLETALAGDAFDVVAVGNDEIVAYVLAKPDGSSTDTLTFHADVEQAQRDGVVEMVSIPDVSLVQDDPPYTLYRITLNSDASTWGTSAFIVREPLAENVRSLTFRYLDSNGDPLNTTFDLATTSDDIGGAESGTPAIQRRGIRRIDLDLVGLTRDPDMGWIDAQDGNATTRSFRKFQLTANVTRRNSGLAGLRDLPTN